MGRFIEKREPTEATYVIELTQTEADMLAGIVADLLDNPQRQVYLDYQFDGGLVMPTKNGMLALHGAQQALNGIKQSDEYDYDDYWETPKKS